MNKIVYYLRDFDCRVAPGFSYKFPEQKQIVYTLNEFWTILRTTCRMVWVVTFSRKFPEQITSRCGDDHIECEIVYYKVPVKSG